jgi:hypothetical protein
MQAQELFVAFKDFPWFKDASIRESAASSDPVRMICTGPTWISIWQSTHSCTQSGTLDKPSAAQQALAAEEGVDGWS